MPAWICPKCGCKVPHIKIFPVRCACGHVEIDHGTLSSESSGTIVQPWEILEDNRRVACRCCSAYNGTRCDKIDAGCRITFSAYIKDPNKECPLGRWNYDDIEFITYEHMAQVTRTLAGGFRDPIDIIIGIPRSGMMPASILATAMHLPLYTIRDNQLEFCGGGYRSPLKVTELRRVLLVDDSISTGRYMQSRVDLLRSQVQCEIITMAIFVSPDTRFMPDRVGQWLQSPHWFEWIILNSCITAAIAVDMDGVICEDTPLEWLDKEENALANAPPLSVPQLLPVRAIVTARSQLSRELTTNWLTNQKAKYNKLILGPWRRPEERTADNVIEFKTQEYIRSGAKLFIESDDWLSQKLAERSQRPVLCWQNRKLYKPTSKPKPTLVFLSEIFRTGGVEAWTIQVCEAAKQYWDCVIAVPHHNNCENRIIKEVMKHARVITGKELCEELCTNADLVATWGGVGTKNCVLRRRKPTIFMSRILGRLGEFHSKLWCKDSKIVKMAISKVAASVFDEPVKIIHPAVDPRRLDPIHERSERELTIGYVGRFVQAKRYTMAAEVGAVLKCQVVYLGTGSTFEVKRIKDIYPSAKVLRPTLKPGAAYQSMDVFIQASPSETGPVTALEAMYCGTRVVSTPVGVILEMEEKYGKLLERVPLEPTIKQVIDAIELAQVDDVTWRKAQQLVQNEYLMEHRMPEWLEFFDTTVKLGTR